MAKNLIARAKLIDPDTGLETPVDVRTCADAVTCNDGHTMQDHVADLANHKADGTAHPSAAKRAEWDAKETPAGAQAKADAAKSAAAVQAATFAEQAKQAAISTAAQDATVKATAAKNDAIAAANANTTEKFGRAFLKTGGTISGDTAISAQLRVGGSLRVGSDALLEGQDEDSGVWISNQGDTSAHAVAFYGNSGDESVLLDNVADPVNNQQAATKGYVDNLVSSGTWAPAIENFNATRALGWYARIGKCCIISFDIMGKSTEAETSQLIRIYGLPFEAVTGNKFFGGGGVCHNFLAASGNAFSGWTLEKVDYYGDTIFGRTVSVSSDASIANTMGYAKLPADTTKDVYMTGTIMYCVA